MSRKAIPKVNYPLKKIKQVARFADSVFGKQRVILECGHEISCSSGAIYRARCYKCGKETL